MLHHVLAAARFVGVTWLVLIAAARIARALAPAARRTPLLETFIVGSVLITGTFAAAGFAGLLSNAVIALGALTLFVVTLPLRRKSDTRPSTRRWLVPALLVSPLLLDLPLGLAAPPVNWDAMTYHLHLPARWIQEGRIFHVPTVFSDNAAAYAPQNGALLFGWSMTLLKSDALTNVMQWAGVGAIAMALYRLSRSLGVRPRAAAVASMTPFWIEPIRTQAASANVDIWMLAFFAAGLAWLSSWVRRPDERTMLLFGLAMGLAAGTKTIGLALGLLVSVPAIAIAIRRRRPKDVGWFTVAALVGGGWWYVRNLALYGNPLFPLDVGPFRGAYGTDAIRAGEFHVDAGTAFMRVTDRWGWFVIAMLFLGTAALFYNAVRHHRNGRARRSLVAGLLGLFSVAWLAWFLFGVPHNDQSRFLLPALTIALAGWSSLMELLGRGSRGALGLALLTFVGLTVFGHPFDGWSAWLRTLDDTEIRSSESARVAAYGRSAYRSWAEGFIPFQNPELEPQRVAYSGANIPYTLTGPGLRHTVIYCNTRGEREDGFYEHWLNDPRTHAYHKPGIYRGPDDSYDTWLANLVAERIDMVVLFALHPAERAYLPATDSGFPPEQRWISEHPERFETMMRGRFAEIHRLRP